MNPLDVRSPLDDLVTQYGGLFLTAGHDILYFLALIIFASYVLKHGITGGMVQFLLQFLVLFFIANNLLKYYYTPSGLLGGLSVHQFFPAVADYYANTIDQSRQDHMFLAIAQMFSGLQKPGWADWTMIPVYWIVQILMWVYQALCLCSIMLAWVALGILNLLGPLFIPWIIVPKLNYLFWNWMQSIWQYSFYRVVAAAMVFVASTCMNVFLDNTIHGNYALAHVAVTMPQLIVLDVAFCWSILRIPTVVSDLFKGSSSAGTNFIGALAGFRRGILH